MNFVCKLLKEEKCVQVEGVYSHLYQTEIAVANKQREEFLFGVMLSKRYFPNVISHLGATYGAMLGKEFAFDLLRVGIGLYGYLPVYQREIQEILTLKKCMRVYAKGVSQWEYRLGGVGYGNGVAKPGEILSTYRFGYADGFLRSRKNGLVNWQKNKNDLCMDATIREGAAKIGEWIPIMTDADAVAKETGTIAYEVLCAATRRAEFIYD